jgi:virginiamycin B lyase
MRQWLGLRRVLWLLAFSVPTPSVYATDHAPGLRGQVVTVDGQGLAGVFVTARHPTSGIETTVYTNANGLFEFPLLPVAEVALTAHHTRYAPALATVDLMAPPAKLELRLAPAQDPMRHASTAAWFAPIPDDDRKREFILNCASCHEFAANRIFKDGQLRDHARWVEGIKLMKALDAYAVIPPDFDTERYADWLAVQLAPEQVAQRTPQPTANSALAGEQVTITEYPLPVPSELPHDLVLGPDWRVWVTAFWSSQMWAMDPATGKFETYEVNNDPKTIAQVRALEFDRLGRLWIVNGGTSSVVRLDPKSREFATFKVDMYPHDLVIDSRGDIWVNDYFAKQERVARVAATDGKVTVFPLPSANLPPSAGVPLSYGLQIDAEDRLWSTQLAANTLARYDIKSGAAKLHTMPDANVGPRRNAIGLDGKVWIPEFNTGRLTSFDPVTETFATFDTGNSAVGVYDVAVDPRSGDVWLAAALASELIRFDVRTHKFTHYPLPTEPAYMRHLAIDPRTGDVWSAYSSLPTAVPKIVRLQRGAPNPVSE